MKKNLKRLQTLLTLLDIELFYTISVLDSSITLQGHFNPEVVLEILKHKFNQGTIQKFGYLEFETN